MRSVRQRVRGELLLQDNKNALILYQVKPPKEVDNLVYLRFALVTRGPGDHIFPAFVLDDWGKEQGSLRLYEWVRENGDRFPRAEIFGYEQDGSETQEFLRGMELYARHPCYAYTSNNLAVTAGHLLFAILLPDASVTKPKRIKRPDDLKLPLRAARVTWWSVPEGTKDFDFHQLDAEPDPGY